MNYIYTSSQFVGRSKFMESSKPRINSVTTILSPEQRSGSLGVIIITSNSPGSVLKVHRAIKFKETKTR